MVQYLCDDSGLVVLGAVGPSVSTGLLPQAGEGGLQTGSRQALGLGLGLVCDGSGSICEELLHHIQFVSATAAPHQVGSLLTRKQHLHYFRELHFNQFQPA